MKPYMVLVLSFWLVISASFCGAVGYHVRVLPPLVEGMNASAYAVNDKGQVVGSAQAGQGQGFPVLWESDTTIKPIKDAVAYGPAAARDINESGLISIGSGGAGIWSAKDGYRALGPGTAHSINESGDIAGSSAQRESCIWLADGTVTGLGSPKPGVMCMANGINDSGTVVGYFGNHPDERPFRWTRSKGFMELPLPPQRGQWISVHAEATAVNNSGLTVGSVTRSNNRPHACAWKPGGSAYDLESGSNGVAYDVNDAGQIAGSVAESSGDSYAVVWDPAGNITRLPLPPGALASSAQGINNKGWIAGFARYPNKVFKAVLWVRSPDSEASKYAPEEVAQGEWVMQEVSQYSDAGFWSSIALDPEGRPAICYTSSRVRSLFYAAWNGSEWRDYTVEELRSGECRECSLVIGRDGKPQVCYVTSEPRTLKHAALDGSTWKVSVLDDSKSFGNPTLAVDSRSQPHAFFRASNDSAKYLEWDGEKWESQLLPDSAGSCIGGNCANMPLAIALDAADSPHVCFHDRNSHTLVYAYKAGSEWIRRVVVEDCLGIGTISLALDAAGRPHVCYYDQSEQLFYTRRDGETWVTSVVDSGLQFQSLAMLKLDSKDRPHIIYYKRGARTERVHDLRYAVLSADGWKTELVDRVTITNISLAVDKSGSAHIAYHGANGGLVYARRNPEF